MQRWRHAVYALVEGGQRGYPLGRAFDLLLVAIILVNVTAIVLGTVEGLPPSWHQVFDLIETAAVLAFTLEYGLRLWAAIEDPRRAYRHPVWGRLHYAVSPLAVIDIVAILPFYLHLFWMPIDPSVAVLLRALRLFKLLRFTGAFDLLGEVLRNERRPLVAAGTVVSVALLMVSTLAYMLEHDAQPDKFGSIPAAMYWGIVTLSTVGYGDLTPITPWGRALAGFTVVLGVLCFALPAGILASGFIEELRRRDFIVTWHLVAKVPLFQLLSAARIAAVASILKPVRVETGVQVVRQGDAADAMYFITAGELEVETPGGPVALGSGEFFGEMALLESGKRSATVTARSNCDLLMLQAADFRHLLAGSPDLENEIRRIAAERGAKRRSAEAETPTPA
ncbi:MAG: ion transporter [Proteobacteria bacterium]|nr:ion transporter [Pseudomonadota bacterium]MBI3498101.1 ion transporter [Pseudomonadota bacterium]